MHKKNLIYARAPPADSFRLPNKSFHGLSNIGENTGRSDITYIRKHMSFGSTLRGVQTWYCYRFALGSFFE